MSDDENLARDEDTPLIELPETILTDLLTVIDTLQDWLDESLAGERAYTGQSATTLNMMHKEFRRMRETNEGVMARARAWLPERD